MEELELVLRVLHSSEITHHMTFIIVSSVGVWGRTTRAYEDLTAPTEEAAPVDPPADGEAPPAEGDAPADGEADPTEAAAPAGPSRRPAPLRSEDYTRRIPAPKFQEWKAIETTALALRDKGYVHPYVVCSGIPYGLGEDAFLGLFKAAWMGRDTLRYIGDGYNYIPCVHARDVGRLVRRIVETKPELEYHLAVDRGDVMQKDIVRSVASSFMLDYEVKSVTVPEALLAELADLLTLDLRLEPSPIMEPTKEEEPSEEKAEEESSAEPPAAGGEEEEEDMTNVATIKPPVNFKWWSEKGIVANMAQVIKEFVNWRRLNPVQLVIYGPPGSGADKIVSMVAEEYQIESMAMDDVLEQLRSAATPLGQSVKDTLDQITAALANPKSTGPFYVPAALMSQTFDEMALQKASGKFRGWVLGGFPLTTDEAVDFFLEDPPPSDPPAEGEEASSDPKADKVFKKGVKPDAVIVLSSSEEACQKRVAEAENPMPENVFQKKMARWNEGFPEEGPKLTDLFSERGLEPLTLEVDEANPEDVCAKIVAHVESTRPVYNFRVTPSQIGTASSEQAAEAKPAADDGSAQRDADGRKKKKVKKRERSGRPSNPDRSISFSLLCALDPY